MHSENILEWWVGQHRHCCNHLVCRMGPFSAGSNNYLPLLLGTLPSLPSVTMCMSRWLLPSERFKTVPYLPNCRSRGASVEFVVVVEFFVSSAASFVHLRDSASCARIND